VQVSKAPAGQHLIQRRRHARAERDLFVTHADGFDLDTHCPRDVDVHEPEISVGAL
jgi:hypothetical protein